MRKYIFFILCFSFCSKNIPTNKISISTEHCNCEFPKYEVKTFEESIKRQREVLEILRNETQCLRKTIEAINQ